MIERQVSPEQEGVYAFENLDGFFLERSRLGILVALLTYPRGLFFTDLKRLCNLTDGNLSRHLAVLSRKDAVEIWKGYLGRRPATFCRLSYRGRESLVTFTAQLEEVTRKAAERHEHRRRAGLSEEPMPRGWILMK